MAIDKVRSHFDGLWEGRDLHTVAGGRTRCLDQALVIEQAGITYRGDAPPRAVTVTFRMSAVVPHGHQHDSPRHASPTAARNVSIRRLDHRDETEAAGA